MPIEALSQTVANKLGASQVLNGPHSVVKELIDNALDAHATRIFIEVSSNLLDIIQVTDDGDGIPVGDRHLICKRHHTSKLRDLNELATIGGSSLGFRGEALASAADLSDGVSITTRTQEDRVATRITFDRTGVLVR